MNAQRMSFAILLAMASSCQTLSTEDVCRAHAATLGVQLDERAVVQDIPGTEQIIYGWEAAENGRPGFQCTTQRGHIQDFDVFHWRTRVEPTG